MQVSRALLGHLGQPEVDRITEDCVTAAPSCLWPRPRPSSGQVATEGPSSRPRPSAVRVDLDARQ